MKSKTTFLLFILSIIIALGLSSCMNSKDQPIPDPYPSLEELKVGFFRNGRILFSAENPGISMFSTTDNVGIRILKETTDDYQEDFACLDFSAVSSDAMTFKVIYYPSQATKTVSQHTLTNGQSLDLNGDEIWDIKLSSTDTTFSKNRSLSDAVFIELNNTPDMATTFRTVPGKKERNYPIMTVNASHQICIDEKALPGFNPYDPGERTIDIDTSTLKLEPTKGDLLLLGPSFNNTMGCPIKKIEKVEGTGSIRTLHLSELNNSEYSQFFRGTKYKNVYSSNPDEPYLIDNREEKDFVLWSGEINHVSQGVDSTIKVYSHEPIQILLSFMDIDFEMGLDNDLKRFFYHPVFAVKGNITMEVNATERNTARTYFFSQPITFDGLDMPLSGNVRFGFSNQSEGDGRVDAHATYRFDETYFSLRIDAQDWDESSQWIPYADFRRNIEIISATGTHNPSNCSINPSLHIDSTLSFLNLFNVHQNDLRFGLKFNNYQQAGKQLLDVIPSFEITSGYDVQYLQQKKAVFPEKVIYSVELSPYSID